LPSRALSLARSNVGSAWRRQATARGAAGF